MSRGPSWAPARDINLTPAQEAMWKQLVATNMLAIDAQLAS